MASISTSSQPTSDAAKELLHRCLTGRPWPDSLLQEVISEQNGRALFSVVVERLADLFDPRLCDAYADLLSRVVNMVEPAYAVLDLRKRYDRVRALRPCSHIPKHILVLSRVTLGADVAVTSVILDGLKRQFQNTRISLVGARKNWELFAADARVEFVPYDYPRGGTVAERIRAVPTFDTSETVVIDPDSRITQLGILPVCDESQYFFFESRGYGGEGDEALPVLVSRWLAETFGISSSVPYICPTPVAMAADVAVSFGVGENLEKRIAGSFERDILLALCKRGFSVVVDSGTATHEAERVQKAANNLPNVQVWSGSYAAFASMISQAKLYVGYDSAGQHAAATCGVPLVSIFAGYVSDRMFERWHPTGPGPKQVLKVTDRTPEHVLQRTLEAVDAIEPIAGLC